MKPEPEQPGNDFGVNYKELLSNRSPLVRAMAAFILRRLDEARLTAGMDTPSLPTRVLLNKKRSKNEMKERESASQAAARAAMPPKEVGVQTVKPVEDIEDEEEVSSPEEIAEGIVKKLVESKYSNKNERALTNAQATLRRSVAQALEELEKYEDFTEAVRAFVVKLIHDLEYCRDIFLKSNLNSLKVTIYNSTFKGYIIGYILTDHYIFITADITARSFYEFQQEHHTLSLPKNHFEKIEDYVKAMGFGILIGKYFEPVTLTNLMSQGQKNLFASRFAQKLAQSLRIIAQENQEALRANGLDSYQVAQDTYQNFIYILTGGIQGEGQGDPEA